LLENFQLKEELEEHQEKLQKDHQEELQEDNQKELQEKLEELLKKSEDPELQEEL